MLSANIHLSVLLKKIIIVFIIFFALLPLLFPLIKSGLFISDDGGWMIVRLSAFHQSLKDGQFPVRWAGRLNHGYGYPVFNFLYPGVLYLGEFIHLVGFNFTDSVKILFALGIVSSQIFAFFWLKEFFSQRASLLGSLIYLYAPYHLFDLYKRGSLGEIMALGIIPGILFFAQRKNYVFSGLLISLLILFHNTLAFLFLPVILGYYCLLGNHLPKRLTSLFLGVMISSFFSLPAFFDRQYTIFDSVRISDWSNYFLDRGYLNLLGGSALLIFCSSLVLIVKRISSRGWFFIFNKHSTNNIVFILFLYFTLIFVFSIFLSSSLSALFWQIFPLPKIVQFPWRFLSLSILGISYIFAYLIDQKINKIIVGGILILSLVNSYSFIKEIKYQNYPDAYYSTNEDSTTVKNEYLPIWSKDKPPQKRAEEIASFQQGKGAISIIKNTSNHLILSLKVENQAILKINKLFFPGWNLKIDSQNVELNSPSYQLAGFYNDGLIRIPLNSKINRIELYWQETPFRLICDLISVLSLIGLFFLVRYKLNRSKTTLG